MVSSTRLVSGVGHRLDANRVVAADATPPTATSRVFVALERMFISTHPPILCRG